MLNDILPISLSKFLNHFRRNLIGQVLKGDCESHVAQFSIFVIGRYAMVTSSLQIQGNQVHSRKWLPSFFEQMICHFFCYRMVECFNACSDQSTQYFINGKCYKQMSVSYKQVEINADAQIRSYNMSELKNASRSFNGSLAVRKSIFKRSNDGFKSVCPSL